MWEKKTFEQEYPLSQKFHIYPDCQQSTHEDSSQGRKDLYQCKDNNLKNNNKLRHI